MFVWVRLDSKPALSFYSVPDALPYLSGLSYRRLINIGDIHRPLKGENSNMDVTLDNADGLLTQFFLDPPIRVKVSVEGYYDSQVVSIFNGVVTSIDFGPEITLSLEF